MDWLASPQLSLLRVLLLLGAVLLFTTWVMSPQHDIRAYGCDPFGYLRQAQLFRDHGWIAGLNTAMTEPDARDFVTAAKAVFGPRVHWIDIVAPHCHHFASATGAVINQYPPLTGFFLSLFPVETAPAALYVTMMLIVAAAFVIMTACARQSSWLGSAVAAASLYLIYRAETYHGMTSSVSLPESVGFGALAALLTLAMARTVGMMRLAIAVALGVLIGVLVGIRIPNAFLVFGISAYLFFIPLSRKDRAMLTLAGCIGLVLGMVPLLAANVINAGGLLATTYGPADASLPTFGPRILWENLGFYFWSAPSAALLIAAICITLGRLAFPRRDENSRPDRAAAVASGVQLLIATAFFLTHAITTGYYIIPASAFALCLVSFDLLTAGKLQPGSTVLATRLVAVVALTLLVAFAVQRISRIEPRHFMVEAPQAMLAPEARVWSDINSGSITYYLNKYAAKASFGDDCMRMALMQQLGREGHPQYLVDDAHTMHKAIAEIQKNVVLEQVGTLDFYDRKSPVYLLKANAVWNEAAPKTCGLQ